MSFDSTRYVEPAVSGSVSEIRMSAIGTGLLGVSAASAAALRIALRAFESVGTLCCC